MTWKEFKDKVEKFGVKDDDDIWYIDVTFEEDINALLDKEYGWKIA